MLTYNIEFVKLTLAKYKKILAAYKLMRAVLQNCPHTVLCRDKEALAKAADKAEQGCLQAEQNISLCLQLMAEYDKQQIVDKDGYRLMLVNISKNLAGLYKLNLLLFNDLLIGADLVQQSYLQDNPYTDKDLDEFYENDETALLALPLQERMEKLQCTDYTEFCSNYPQLVSAAEFADLVKAGLITSADDIILHNNRMYENEFSEQWEEYEYEYDKYRKNK